MQLGSLPLVQQTAMEAMTQAATPRVDQKQGADQTAQTSALQDRAATIPTGDETALTAPQDRGLGASFRASEPVGNAALSSAVMAALATSLSTGAAQSEEAATAPQAGMAPEAITGSPFSAQGIGPGAQQTAVETAVDRSQAARASETERSVLERSERQNANTSIALADTQAAFRAGAGYTEAARALAETTKLQTTRTDFFVPQQAESEANTTEQMAVQEAAAEAKTDGRTDARASDKQVVQRMDLGLDGPEAQTPAAPSTQGANSPVERAYREAAQMGATGNAAAEQMGQMAGPSAAQAAEEMRAG